MADTSQKRKRRIDTFQARELHEQREQLSIRSFIQYGLLAGCSLQEMERRKNRLLGN